MIRHAMHVIKASVNHLNPGQVPVIAMDQPLYAVAKRIQWNWKERYGEQKFVIMFGGLHQRAIQKCNYSSLVRVSRGDYNERLDKYKLCEKGVKTVIKKIIEKYSDQKDLLEDLRLITEMYFLE